MDHFCNDHCKTGQCDCELMKEFPKLTNNLAVYAGYAREADIYEHHYQAGSERRLPYDITLLSAMDAHQSVGPMADNFLDTLANSPEEEPKGEPWGVPLLSGNNQAIVERLPSDGSLTGGETDKAPVLATLTDYGATISWHDESIVLDPSEAKRLGELISANY